MSTKDIIDELLYIYIANNYTKPKTLNLDEITYKNFCSDFELQIKEEKYAVSSTMTLARIDKYNFFGNIINVSMIKRYTKGVKATIIEIRD
jgi:hypothetical protein